MLLLPTGPINPPLFPLCHTVLSAQRAQQLAPPQPCYAQCWHFQNSFPPSHCPSLWSPFIPLPPSPPLGFHHLSQHATYSVCSWWLVTLPSLTFTFITSKLRHSFSFLSFPSLYFLISLSTPGLRLGEIPFQHVFMTESKGRVNGTSVGAGLCEARTWSSCTAGVEQSPPTLFYCL